ncbi:L-ribulose-5-phosphate 4-epimerase [Sedimentibacter saalensis]|uniref:L-ribulose-5-phosphate 4-epimerase n=1 Tax=Sedimentibacter saalensis TaxID=130788 RepID=UPI0028A03616|nr:L-ribulose-5-phosphate 4-epimerase [Sedimentibacter saalensis]MEA5096203.1 L-ribulose-5-phosphate 4-epimerase [Sedimentibacter saalensis]
MYTQLKNRVYEANMLLPKHNLVKFTWGNVSEIDRENSIIGIKPSGIEYEDLTPNDIVIVDLETGNVVEGNLKPSSDTKTHLEIYRNFDNVGGIVHTHSQWATIFSQIGEGIPALGTTHADYFYGNIPVTRLMTNFEIDSNYEENTGKVIVETFKELSYNDIPSVLVHSHGPFSWGKDANNAVHNAVVLEEVAFMAWHSLINKSNLENMQQELLDKHYLRKHGKNSYYGQK